MTSRSHAAEKLVEGAAAMLRVGGSARLGEFDQFPAPLYATNANGTVVYFNAACIDFAGRAPTVGVDRWCVTWKLYGDDGSFLAHDQCPMAVAIQQGRTVRGVEAIAERPDGSRTRFRPFPTPVVGEDGDVVGAINLLVPVDGKLSRALAARAEKCRHLAKWICDKRAGETLSQMAAECEGQAEVLRLH